MFLGSIVISRLWGVSLLGVLKKSWVGWLAFLVISVGGYSVTPSAKLSLSSEVHIPNQTYLDTSVFLKPSVFFQQSKFQGILTAWFNKPFNPYEPIQMNYFSMRASHSFFSFQASALSPHRWNTDGASVRIAPGLFSEWPIDDWWKVQARLSPLFFLNSYSTRADGTAQPAWGFLEYVGVEANSFPFAWSFLLVCEQTFQSTWKNKLGYAMTFEIKGSQNFSIGLGIENEFFTISESTGLRNPGSWLDTSQLTWLSFFKVTL